MFATDLLKLIIDALLAFFGDFLADAILGALGVGGE